MLRHGADRGVRTSLRKNGLRSPSLRRESAVQAFRRRRNLGARRNLFPPRKCNARVPAKSEILWDGRHHRVLRHGADRGVRTSLRKNGLRSPSLRRESAVQAFRRRRNLGARRNLFPPRKCNARVPAKSEILWDGRHYRVLRHGADRGVTWFYRDVSRPGATYFCRQAKVGKNWLRGCGP